MMEMFNGPEKEKKKKNGNIKIHRTIQTTTKILTRGSKEINSIYIVEENIK